MYQENEKLAETFQYQFYSDATTLSQAIGFPCLANYCHCYSVTFSLVNAASMRIVPLSASLPVSLPPGKMWRQRTVVQASQGDGRPCPPQMEQWKPCPVRPCYRWQYGFWSECRVEVCQGEP